MSSKQSFVYNWLKELLCFVMIYDMFYYTSFIKILKPDDPGHRQPCLLMVVVLMLYKNNYNWITKLPNFLNYYSHFKQLEYVSVIQ
jgi:hypothetical protein